MFRLGDVALYGATWIPLALALLCAWATWCFLKRRRFPPAVGMGLLAALLLGATKAGVPVVFTSAQLGYLPSYQATAVLRLGVNTPGDADPVWFKPQSSACAISGGDVGSQVASVDGGCFIAQYPATGADVRNWNQTAALITGGTADATASIQAAISAVQGWQGRLNFGPYLYRVSSTLTATGIIDLEGVNGNHDVYQGRQTNLGGCTTGFVTDSNINLLIFTGLHGAVRNLCFDMAAAPNTRTAGWALIAGATSTTSQGHVLITDNTILNAFDGVSIGIPSGISGLSPTTGSTQTNSDVVRNNTITRASDISLANGSASTGASTNGTELRGNEVTCFGAGTGGGTGSVGILIGDGGIFYDGANGGSYQCGRGFKIVEGPGQILGGGEFSGVMCDTSYVYCTEIDSTGGTVYVATFSNFWMGGNTNATAATLYIHDSSKGAHVLKLTFNSGIIDVNNGNQSGGPLPAVDIEDDVYAVQFVGNQINEMGNGSYHDLGFKIGGSANILTIVGNDFQPVNAASYLASAVQFAGSGDDFTVTGNNFGNAGGPSTGYEPFDLSGWTSATRRLAVSGNATIDTAFGGTATVTGGQLAIKGSYQASFVPNAVATLNQMNNWWYGRTVRLLTFPPGSNTVTFATGGGTAAGGYIPFCNASTLGGTTNFLLALADYAGGSPCWRLK